MHTLSGRVAISVLSGVLAAAPLVAFAQPVRVYQIGFLIQRPIPAGEAATAGTPVGEFVRALRELGYVEGKSVVIHWRSAEGRLERLPELASALAQQKVDIIVAPGAQAISAAQQATRQIPIVMGTTGDPVGSGFVRTLQRPGGNITGLSDITASDLGPKLVDLMRSAVPTLTHVALMTSPDNASHAALVKSIPAAAKRVQVKVTLINARVPREFDAAFATAARERAEAVIVAADGVFNTNAAQIAQTAEKYRLPVVSSYLQYADAGGLMSYGTSFAHNLRRAAVYVDKILKGANPAELPVEQPSKIELIVNRRAAKAVGISLPQDLLLRADRVIE